MLASGASGLFNYYVINRSLEYLLGYLLGYLMATQL